MRRASLLATFLALFCACQSTSAYATQAVKLEVALTPERLGTPTTILFGFTIATTTGKIPSPLLGIDLLYPANLGIATSGLGLENCTPTTLETAGPTGCPTDSLMGHGNAFIEVPFGPEIVEEGGQITTFMAPLQNGNLGLLFYVYGKQPVFAQLVFPGLILPSTTPYGGRLHVNIPLIPSLPEGPDASVTRLHTTIGPLGLTYYEHTHGKTIAYHPKGIGLPNTCPHGGFPFAATFTFLDGTNTTATSIVPCPK